MIASSANINTGILFLMKEAWVNSYKSKSFQKYEKNVTFCVGLD